MNNFPFILLIPISLIFWISSACIKYIRNYSDRNSYYIFYLLLIIVTVYISDRNLIARKHIAVSEGLRNFEISFIKIYINIHKLVSYKSIIYKKKFVYVLYDVISCSNNMHLILKIYSKLITVYITRDISFYVCIYLPRE